MSTQGSPIYVHPGLTLALGVLTILLALVMFSMGCNVELKKFLGHIKRPWGICVGFLCQFGIMPLTGFILSVAFAQAA